MLSCFLTHTSFRKRGWISYAPIDRLSRAGSGSQKQSDSVDLWSSIADRLCVCLWAALEGHWKYVFVNRWSFEAIECQQITVQPSIDSCCYSERCLLFTLNDLLQTLFAYEIQMVNGATNDALTHAPSIVHAFSLISSAGNQELIFASRSNVPVEVIEFDCEWSMSLMMSAWSFLSKKKNNCSLLVWCNRISSLSLNAILVWRRVWECKNSEYSFKLTHHMQLGRNVQID